MSNLLKSRRAKGMVAAACGVALLLGGSTLALWSDSDTVGGGVITAGNLELKANSFVALDVSKSWDGSDYGDLRRDQDDSTNSWESCGIEELEGHYINPDGDPSPAATQSGTEPWRIIPGDTISVIAPLRIGLQGDNMLADLALGYHGNRVSGEDYLSDNIAVDSATLYYKEGTASKDYAIPATDLSDLEALLRGTNGATDPVPLLTFQGPLESYGQSDGTLYPIISDPVAPAATAPNVCLQINFTYDATAGDVDSVIANQPMPDGSWSPTRPDGGAPTPTGSAIPTYVTDLDDGSGKNPVEGSPIPGTTSDVYGAPEYNRWEVGDVMIAITDNLRFTLQQTREAGKGLFN